ncbi:tyrosine-type recombinase/integrase [Streptomyces sp. DG2A-72]|uniref:tyrosine-type recombinase/integrase n=1 Tax=Streptomyces sp. DG2A-72 TaxID=3051386 RepID=UPI00265B80EE|nr:tyrosine-type recombinase/integrase [Streptomyces sp. DG2A-72]MDO0938494.1 tyrosine-type recombinase/integrase [Streptomyces sp. DG2A-72]
MTIRQRCEQVRRRSWPRPGGNAVPPVGCLAKRSAISRHSVRTVHLAPFVVEAIRPYRVPRGNDGATLHSLRDFCASVLIAQGESIKGVQRALGHSKPSTTLNHYVHLWEAAEDTTRDAVTAGMAGIATPPQTALNVPSAIEIAA